jgi:hypothetical protein
MRSERRPEFHPSTEAATSREMLVADTIHRLRILHHRLADSRDPMSAHVLQAVALIEALAKEATTLRTATMTATGRVGLDEAGVRDRSTLATVHRQISKERGA